MKSITIHGIEEQLDREIRGKAKKQGLSLNRTIKQLLREHLGLTDKVIDRRDDFREFSGVWSEEEARAISQATADFERIDRGDWQ